MNFFLPDSRNTDAERFVAIFTNPVDATERCQQIAVEHGIVLNEVPAEDVLNCMRFLCDVLLQESSLSI